MEEVLGYLRPGPPGSEAFLSSCLARLSGLAARVGHTQEEVRGEQAPGAGGPSSARPAKP